MVKIPKAPKVRILFRDEQGKFVKQSERYQKARVVQRLFRGKYHVIMDLRGTKRKVTPKSLVDLLPRDTFESLAPNYAAPVEVAPQAKKYTAWDAAGKAQNLRGIRGHMVKVEMLIRDGKQTKKIGFYTKIRRKGAFQYSLFRSMNRALANEKTYLYNRIGSKLLPDRKGKKVHLVSIAISKEL